MYQTHRAPVRRIGIYLCACLAMLGLASGIRDGIADEPRININNFGRINQNYYRGAQPSADRFLELKGLGIKTVVDLQEDGKSKEPRWVSNAGMQYFKIPLSSRRPATAAETDYFLNLVNDPNNWPVYVHCAGGRHRTGEMTAIYRITQNSWTAEQAYEEMLKYDYYSWGGHGSLKDYVFDYYEKFSATQGAVANRALQKSAQDIQK